MKRLLFAILIFTALCAASCSTSCPGPDYDVKSFKMIGLDYNGRPQDAVGYFIVEDDSIIPYMAKIAHCEDGYNMDFRSIYTFEVIRALQNDTILSNLFKAKKIKKDRTESQNVCDMIKLFSEAYSDNDSIIMISTGYSVFMDLNIDISNYLQDHKEEYLKHENDKDDLVGMRPVVEMARMINEQTNKSHFRKTLDNHFLSFSKVEIDTIQCGDPCGELHFFPSEITKKIRAKYKNKKLPAELLATGIMIKLKRK